MSLNSEVEELKNIVGGQQGHYLIKHAIDVIYDTYSDVVSVDAKKKDLLKFGTHTTIGTGWETLAEMQDSETEETFVSGAAGVSVAGGFSGFLASVV